MSQQQPEPEQQTEQKLKTPDQSTSDQSTPILPSPKELTRKWFPWHEYVRIQFDQMRLSKGLPLPKNDQKAFPKLTAKVLCTTGGTREVDKFEYKTIKVPQSKLKYKDRGYAEWNDAVYPQNPNKGYHMASFIEPIRLFLNFRGILLTGEFVLGNYEPNGNWWVPMYANKGERKNHVASILVKVSSAPTEADLPKFDDGPPTAEEFRKLIDDKNNGFKPVACFKDLTPNTFLDLDADQPVFEIDSNYDAKVRQYKKQKQEPMALSVPYVSETHHTGENLDQNYNWVCLYMQGDHNLVIYVNGVAQWASWTQNSGANRLYFQGDGNLVLRDKDMNPLWWTSTQHSNGINNKLEVDSNGYCYIHYNTQLLWIAYWP